MSILVNTYHICVYNRFRPSVDAVIDDLNRHVEMTRYVSTRCLYSIGTSIYNKLKQWKYVIVTIHNDEYVIDTAVLKFKIDTYVKIMCPDDVRSVQRIIDIADKRSYFTYEYTYENQFIWPINQQLINQPDYKFKSLIDFDVTDLRSSNLICLEITNEFVRCRPINTSYSMFYEDMYALLNTILLTKNGSIVGVCCNDDSTFDFYYQIDMHHMIDYDLITMQLVDEINEYIYNDEKLIQLSDMFDDPLK